MWKRLVTFFVAAIVLALAAAAFAATVMPLPDDLVGLIPEGSGALVAISSVNELADQYVAILAAVGESDTSREDVLQTIGDLLAGLQDFVDLDKPLVVAAGIPNIMMGQSPPITYLVPLRSGIKDYDGFGGEDIAVRRAAGSYLALSTDPLYEPSASRPELVAGLADGVIAGTLDFALVNATVGPMVDMGLAMAASGEDNDPAAAVALADVVHKLMDSVTRLDMSLAHDGEFLTEHTAVQVKPGSALDPGPQPDFQRALALSGLLPDDVDFVQATAVDYRRISQSFEDYYVMSVTESLEGLDDEQVAQYSAWVRRYLDNMEVWSQPSVAAFHIDGVELTAYEILEAADADKTVAWLNEIIGEMTDLNIGFNMTRQGDKKIGGVKFSVWDVSYDAEILAAVMPTDEGPDLTGMGRTQAQQMIAVMQKITAPVYLGAGEGKVFLATAKDTEDLARMVKKARRQQQPRALVKAIAAKSGPACHQVIAGDMMAILNWVASIYSELSSAEQEIFADHPIPFEVSVAVSADSWGMDVGMDLNALGRLVQVVQELEALDEDAGQDD